MQREKRSHFIKKTTVIQHAKNHRFLYLHIIIKHLVNEITEWKQWLLYNFKKYYSMTMPVANDQPIYEKDS